VVKQITQPVAQRFTGFRIEQVEIRKFGFEYIPQGVFKGTVQVQVVILIQDAVPDIIGKIVTGMGIADLKLKIDRLVFGPVTVRKVPDPVKNFTSAASG
jgi:hypothetical protein